MHVLKVISTPDEPTFPSFSEAVNAGRNSRRHIASRNTSKELAGAIVLDFAFGFSWLDLYLSGNRSLHVYLDVGTVRWELQSGVAAKKQSEAEPTLYLDFRHLSEPYAWDRVVVLSACLNKSIKMLSASIAWLFLTVEDNPTLMFSRLKIPQ